MHCEIQYCSPKTLLNILLCQILFCRIQNSDIYFAKYGRHHSQLHVSCLTKGGNLLSFTWHVIDNLALRHLIICTLSDRIWCCKHHPHTKLMSWCKLENTFMAKALSSPVQYSLIWCQAAIVLQGKQHLYVQTIHSKLQVFCMRCYWNLNYIPYYN